MYIIAFINVYNVVRERCYDKRVNHSGSYLTKKETKMRRI